jgi:hypothetical protein
VPSFLPIHGQFWGDRHRDIFPGAARAERIDPARSAIDRHMKITLHHDARSPRMRHGSTSRRTARACTLPDRKINAELIALVSRLRPVFAVFTGISGCI